MAEALGNNEPTSNETNLSTTQNDSLETAFEKNKVSPSYSNSMPKNPVSEPTCRGLQPI
jgi:hypothetical protein